ncbi:MAG: DUF971 domain-containing protein [Verrucomicrobiota bacterium]
MNPSLQTVSIQKIGAELAIAWSDGGETYVPTETLRRACPCASCGGEPDVLGHLIRPDIAYAAESFELTGWEMVGGYGFQPRWGDGHRTGIYPFPFLRKLGGSFTA